MFKLIKTAGAFFDNRTINEKLYDAVVAVEDIDAREIFHKEICEILGLTWKCDIGVFGNTGNEHLTQGLTPLHVAVEQSNIEAVTILVKLMRDINLRHQGNTKILKYAKYLLGTLESKDSEGFTPLHYASQKGSIKVIEAFGDLGSAINSLASQAQTPVFLSIINDQKNAAIYLITKGADISIKKPIKYSALEKLCDKAYADEVIFTWLACGGDPRKLSQKFITNHPNLYLDVDSFLATHILHAQSPNTLITAINHHSHNVSQGKVIVDRDNPIPTLQTLCIRKILNDRQKVVHYYDTQPEVSGIDLLGDE